MQFNPDRENSREIEKDKTRGFVIVNICLAFTWPQDSANDKNNLFELDM
jgi:hypothetical protein